MNNTSEQTLYDRLVRRIRNKPIIVAGLIVFTVLVGIGTLTNSIQKIWVAFESTVLGRTSELRTEYCELLRPLVLQLDRTKAAFDLWNGKDLSLESETIRDGNLKARALLEEKGELVPDTLREDQKKLIYHYDRWLEEYDRVRVKRTSDPNQPFVFVYSFPRDSEQRFRDRMAFIEKQLGSNARCK
jgi:hypothetical protein